MAQPWTERFSQADIAPAGIMTAWFNDLRLSDSDVKKLQERALQALLSPGASGRCVHDRQHNERWHDDRRRTAEDPEDPGDDEPPMRAWS